MDPILRWTSNTFARQHRLQLKTSTSVSANWSLYKQIKIAVQAFNQLGRQLLVVGEGPQRGELGKIAGPTPEFYRVDGTTLHQYYARCKALVFTADEDFGIVPIEAMVFRQTGDCLWQWWSARDNSARAHRPLLL